MPIAKSDAPPAGLGFGVTRHLAAPTGYVPSCATHAARWADMGSL
jgi:hypothetical protein